MILAGAGGPMVTWRQAVARVRSLEARLHPRLNEDSPIEELHAAETTPH